jgi:hypothetical protein
LQLVTQQGAKTTVSGTPAVLAKGQGGMLGVFLSPHYKVDHNIYLTYSEPGDGGSSLALARAKLVLGQGSASLAGLQVIWRDPERGNGGQFGAQVAFSPDGKFLYLTSGDRQRMTPAQDPNQPLGKILRLTLDGKPAPGNPMYGKRGAATVPIIDPPANTEAAKTAPVVRKFTFHGPNLTPSETWVTGLRTPYGLAFAPDGRLWELEHGPRGGDELNLIEPGKNYGWPLVSYGHNYDGVPIPSPDTRSDLAKPVIYWVPVIAPGNLFFYKGSMFPSTARAERRPLSAGTSTSASAMSRSPPTVPSGSSRTRPTAASSAPPATKARLLLRPGECLRAAAVINLRVHRLIQTVDPKIPKSNLSHCSPQLSLLRSASKNPLSRSRTSFTVLRDRQQRTSSPVCRITACCPSTVSNPWFGTCSTRTVSRASPRTTMGRSVSRCGQIGVTTIASTSGVRIGPFAASV